eukprot:g10564.t1
MAIQRAETANKADAFKKEFDQFLAKQARRNQKNRLKEFRRIGAYKYYTKRVTKPGSGLRLKYYEVRDKGKQFKTTFNEEEIKVDMETYFKQWIGWEFKDEWLPPGIMTKVNKRGQKHYYVITEGNEGYDKAISETFRPTQLKLNFSSLHEPIDAETFEKYLNFIHPSSATGSSGLPLFSLDFLDIETKDTLRQFINDIIKTRNVPAFLQKLQIWCLAKKENKPCSRGNARPIGLLEHFTKIIECILKDRLDEIFKGYEIELFPNQFGFMKSMSTTNPVHMIINAMGEAKDELKTICLCLADVKKAYDSILPFAIELGCRRIGMNDIDIELICSLFNLIMSLIIASEISDSLIIIFIVGVEKMQCTSCGSLTICLIIMP